MFWQSFYNVEDSHIKELVGKEDTTLDRVLDESDVIQECKGRNDKLLEFLCRPENLIQLVSHVTVEPSEETCQDDAKRYHKAFVSSELLTSDNCQLTEALSSSSTLMEQLFRFIRTRDPLNSLLASFFSNVVQGLLKQKPNVILEFFKDNTSLVDDIVYHVDTSAIMDLILKLVVCFETSITRFKVCHWLRDVRLIEKLIDTLKDDAGSETLCNTCQLLCDVMKVCRDPQETFKGAKDALLIELESEETIRRLICTVTSSKNKHLVRNGMNVLQSYLVKVRG